MGITVNPRRCPANHRCPAVRVCPVDALKQKGLGVPMVDEEACIDCAKCVRTCPTGALRT